MNSVWQQFTLYNLPLRECLNTSRLHRLVGLVRSWRQSSLLMQWADPIAAGLLSLVYIIAPFVPNNTTLLGVLLVACAAFWVLLTLADETSNLNGVTPIHFLVFLYWGIATLATAFSPVKKAAVGDWINVTLLLLLFPLCVRVLKSPRLRSWIIAVYLHVSLIVSVYGIQQWFAKVKPLATWVDPESSLANITRVYSYLGNPNLLAGYLLPAVALSLMAVFVWQSWPTKALAATMFVVNTACLILTFSRGGWIALVAMFVVALVLLLYWWSIQMTPFWRTWALPIILGSMILFLLLAVVVVPPVRERISSIFAGRGDSSNNFRINVWAAVKQMIHDHPILGIGPGHAAFNKIYPLYQKGPRYTALSAYSILLEIAVETGLIGLACFGWLLVVTFNIALMQLQKMRATANLNGFWLIGAITAMLGMLAHGIAETVWYRPSVNTVWWLMVALIASYWSPPRSNVEE
jgi:putative inorganic carbon (hco3(-)) transporter